MRVAELGHAVYGVLFVLYPRGLVGLFLVPTPTVLHAQHHRDGGQHGHGHGHGQHDHEHAVDGSLHHLGLFLHGHVLGLQVPEYRRPLVSTVGARVTGRTFAPKAVAATAGRRQACATVGTRRRRAFVHEPAAVFTPEPGSAAAPEVVFQILARTTVGARFGHAVVHLAQAHIAYVPRNALATKTVGLRLARAAVLARVLLTVVGQVTVGPGESYGALARVAGTVFARYACGPVPARVRLTMIGCLMARRTGKSDWAVANEPVVVVTTSGTVVVVFSVDASAAVAAGRASASRLRRRLTSDTLPLARTRTAGDDSVFL